jgi:hypothetical protein
MRPHTDSVDRSTRRIYRLLDEERLTYRELAAMLLGWLSDADIGEFLKAHQLDELSDKLRESDQC